MTWTEFANKLDAKFEKKSNPFLGGEKIFRVIEKEYADKNIRIQKEIRKSYGASSHSNFEKLEFEFSLKNAGFGKYRIIRKNYFSRIGKKTEQQYSIEGDNPISLKTILLSNELKYLLQHSNSELITLKNNLIFKTQFQGEMNEDLEHIFNSIQFLMSRFLEGK